MSHEINFFTENVTYVLRKKGDLRKWISATIGQEGKFPGDINVVVCDDDYLAELNFKYLKHKTLTDILTFPFDDENGLVCGDIFISWPRVQENAVKFGQIVQDELHRVIIHGILHLCGYDDSTKSAKLKMTAKENFYLAEFSVR